MPTGRPRKPTNLKIIEGNRGRRKLDPASEPQPVVGVPDMPSDMPERSQKLWLTLVPELDRLNLLTLVDSTALEGAVRAYAQAISADILIEKIQQKVSGPDAAHNDFYQLSIMMSASKKAWTQWKSFCTEFGLTPAARGRLSVVNPTGSLSSHGKADYVELALTENRD
jgi:P27 family predicted phage terminase small subunit